MDPLSCISGSTSLLHSHPPSIPQVAANINVTDDGMRTHEMNLKDGSTAHVVLWSLGDTTCGVILDDNEVLGVIEDMEIRLPPTQ